ncbi:PEP-CTERM sorting domain-containing protein [uncultured Aquabacterium sp.]|uniref:PEP-CTERM sorting domain-containing protein n=1 Tax=uncultured Aquabacterium sp. TaxID=158753 RepID=UPI0034575F08
MRVTAVPEPASVGLMALGLLGVAAVRRRGARGDARPDSGPRWTLPKGACRRPPFCLLGWPERSLYG